MLPILNAVYEVLYLQHPPFARKTRCKRLNRRISETIGPIATRYRTFHVAGPQCRL